MQISIKENGDIFFDKKKITHQEAEQTLLSHNKKTAIELYSDKNATFQNFVFILDILKKNQYENLGIVTKNE